MDSKFAYASILCLICMVCKTSLAEQFKLSSLPHLKKWEIPSMPNKYAMRTGRKFKNLDSIFTTGRKRSSHWSILPELKFRELDMEEDAEKVMLDQNYKAFLEEDDIPVKNGKLDGTGIAGLKTSHADAMETTGKRSEEAKTPWQNSKKKLSDKRHGIIHTPQNVAPQKKINGDSPSRSNLKSVKGNSKLLKQVHKNTVFNKKQVKPFLAKGAMLNSSEGQGHNTFSTADIRSRISGLDSRILNSKGDANMFQNVADNFESKFPLEYEEKVAKRSVNDGLYRDVINQKRNQGGIVDAVRKARMAINNLQNRRQGIGKPAARQNLMKLVSLKAGRAPKVDLVDSAAHNKMLQKNVQESRNQALRLLKNSGLNNKGQFKNGVLGDQPSKEISRRVKNNVQMKPVFPSVNNNHPKPANSALLTKAHQTRPTQGSQISERTKIETPRGEIEKPKEKMKIAPANVARAVAMAMEQLKRDKMWGKVFVHVLPSGKLKVMVQETKKMPDE